MYMYSQQTSQAVTTAVTNKVKNETFKDIRANCLCASLLRMLFYIAMSRHVMHRARGLSKKYRQIQW